MSAVARNLLDEFNNGNWDEVGSYFDNDFEIFLTFLEKNGLGGDVDYNQVDDEFKNVVLVNSLEKRPEESLKLITHEMITDVYPMEGGYYLFLRDREELAELFKDYGRDTSPRDVAKSVLGEDYWEPFDDTTYDVYNDVIDELDDENKNRLAHYIIKNLGNQELPLDDYESDLFNDFSNEQGTEGIFQITSENVMELINDEEAMNELLKGDLSDLKSELYSIHSSAYNTAYSDQIYKGVWGELSTYFDMKSWKTETKETRNGTKVQHEYVKINDFYGDVKDFLTNNLHPVYTDQHLEYFGSYIGVITNMMDSGEREWLNFRIPEYADWSDTKKNINELFGDYI